MRRLLPSRLASLVLLVTLAACASAGKRVEQGADAEAEGDYLAAATRYVQALEKEPVMAEAREGLLRAWNAALAQGTAFAREAVEEGDPVGAAGELRALDRLQDAARGVGVVLTTPADHPAFRRRVLDDAIATVMSEGDALRRDRRWRDAREAYRRVVEELDPDGAQRRASLDAQVSALVEWAEDDFLEGRYRMAWLRAGEALEVAPRIPADLADAATSLRERALGSGLRVLAVFPVEATEEVRRAALTELTGPLSDLLETGHWRRPPLFVAVADPASVRRLARRFSPPGTPLQPPRVLEEAGADFGALVELVALEAEERDVRTTRRAARTVAGDTTSYAVEEGRIHYALVAEVTLFDERGNPWGSFRVRSDGGEGYRRARWDGDPGTLQLGRGERLLFNPGEERRQRALLQESLLEELATEVAEGVWERVVDRIP